MTSCLRVLSTQELDSFPSILLVSPNGKKILVNCGEGCQRIFLEHGQKVSSIDTVCLTHLGHESLGGLPGMILTASDVLKMATESAKQAAIVASQQRQQNQKQPSKSNGSTRDNNSSALPIQPGLKILGPRGTHTFFRSLRHFMRRDFFSIDIREGSCLLGGPSSQGSRKNNKKSSSNPESESFKMQSFSAFTRPSKKRPRTTEEHAVDCTSAPLEEPREILSFLFTTPPIQGRFLIEKAKELGVPRGPLYGKLKAGQSVTFPKSGSDTETITVESHEVVEPGSPGVVVAVLSYPSLDILDQLKTSPELQQFYHNAQETQTETAHSTPNNNTKKKKRNEKDEKPVLELIVHMAPRSVFDSDSSASWRNSCFDKNVRHLFVRAEATTALSLDTDANSQSLSAFQSAHSGAHLRSKVSADVFRAPMVVEKSKDNSSLERDTGVVDAVPLLEYVLLPRARRGFANHDAFLRKWNAMEEEGRCALDTSGCLDKVKVILEEFKDAGSNNENGGEILFTGTGSAIPCKHRNVSGIYVRMENGNSMLLDVGEGTIGQLLRAKQHKEHRTNGETGLSDVLKKIKAVWISHPHADHHLGIIRLLEERKRLLSDRDPLVLIAPPNILGFLQDYEMVEPRVADSYIFLDCRSLKSSNGAIHNDLSQHKAALQRLEQDLGIQKCTTIPVAHCAHSYAVVFHGTSFGSLAYSGDCRPSKNFAEVAYNADVLIHEATFADGMEADALVKRHCTAGEALQVAKNMNAKTTILTHFSQRYPKIPLDQTKDTENTDSMDTTPDSSNMKIIHAFDFMTITPSNIPAASKLTPALQMLYADDSDEITSSAGKTDAQAALEVPGLFAQSELL